MSSSLHDPRPGRGKYRLALALTAPMLVFTPVAQAYIDPGTGSLILQGLVAAIAGVAVTVGVYWERFKAFFRRTHDDARSADANKRPNHLAEAPEQTRGDD